MKFPLACLAFLYVLRESYGYKSCAYSSYSHTYGKYVTRYYRCSSSQYCCGTSSCCGYAYTRWYLWFVIVLVFFVIFICWWYYRYRYRPRHVVVGQSSALQVTQGHPAIVTNGNVNVIRVNAPQPIYPLAGPVSIMPGGTSVHYAAAYPPPVYGPVQTYHPPPPAYTSVVKTGTSVTTTSVQ